MKYCDSCKTEFCNDEVYCAECGRKLIDKSTSDQNQNEQKDLKKKGRQNPGKKQSACY